MSNVITWLIVGIVGVALVFAFVKGLWSAVSNPVVRLTIQIVLFGILLICVGKVLFTRDNLNKIHENVERTGIGDNVAKTLRSSFGNGGVDEPKKESMAQKAETATETAKPPAELKTVKEPVKQEEPVDEKQVEPMKASAAPAKPAEAAKAVEKVGEQLVEPQKPVIEKPETTPQVIDYGKYDKGRKEFTYALPFNVKVMMSFKDGGYRLVTESLGELSGEDKKEIGKLILKALSAYTGKDVPAVDKTKVSIDVKYDEGSNHTQVFVAVPLAALPE